MKRAALTDLSRLTTDQHDPIYCHCKQIAGFGIFKVDCHALSAIRQSLGSGQIYHPTSLFLAQRTLCFALS